MKKITKIILGTILGGTALAASVSVLTPPSISEKISNKPQIEKSQIKSLEIAKKGNEFAGIYDSIQYGIRIEIIGDVKAIEINGQHGIELFAKAWRGTQRLGFGGDGTVEIERFRIFNPPILVDDPNGTIIKTHTRDDGVLVTRKFKEDPIEAIRQVIAHNVKIVGKDNNQIITGKIGNTTSTFYPAAGQVSPVDGRIRRTNESTWADARDNATGDVAEPTAASFSVQSNRISAADYNVFVGFYLFDTSTIGTDSVDSATASFYQNGGSIPETETTSTSVIETNPASNSDLVVGDFSTRVFTDLGSLALTSWSINAYNDHILNATGLTKINRTGISKLGLTTLLDVNNTAPGAFGQNGPNDLVAADTAGTTQDPKLVVVHSVPGSSKTIIKGKVIFQGKTIMR